MSGIVTRMTKTAVPQSVIVKASLLKFTGKIMSLKSSPLGEVTTRVDSEAEILMAWISPPWIRSSTPFIAVLTPPSRGSVSVEINNLIPS